MHVLQGVGVFESFPLGEIPKGGLQIWELFIVEPPLVILLFVCLYAWASRR